MLWRTIITYLVLLLSLSLNARMEIEYQIFDWFKAPGVSTKKKVNFFGLTFLINEKNTKCSSTKPGLMLCELELAGLSDTNKRAKIVLEKRSQLTNISLALVRLIRQERWKKENHSLNQYVEGKVATGVGELILQSAQAFHLNNIYLPVLLRAFDVVMFENTIISVSVKCDSRDWPALEKEINSIETSLKKMPPK